MIEIKKIYASSDYGIFEFMPGNRPIRQKKLNRMKKRLQQAIEVNKEYPFMLIRVTPGKNGKYLISDGQHTYLTLKALNLPINFYIVKDEKIDHVRMLNSDMTNWDIWDYVASYADTGNSNYIRLIELREKYKHFNQNELFVSLALHRYRNIRSTNKEIIKTGQFKFKNYDKVLVILDHLSDYKIVKGIRYTEYLFLRAVLYLITTKKYNHDRMIDQIRKYPNFIKMASIDEYLGELLKKYNYNRKRTEKLSMYEIKL